MKELNNPIKDYTVLYSRYIMRDGFPFTCVTRPINVFDAILVKPTGASAFSPRFPDFNMDVEQYVSFINKHKLNKAFIIDDDISFLDRVPTLEYIVFVPSDSSNTDFDFSPLYRRTNLKYLKCHTRFGFNFQKQCKIDYSKINNLVYLDIPSGEGQLNCNALEMIKTLSVLENRCKNLYELFSSKQIDVLKIVDSWIVNLEGIQQSNKIQFLELYGNRKLEDINALDSVSKTLKCLSIQKCSKIKDFSVLGRLDNLEVLYLYGNNNLPNLDFLRDMKKLKVFGFDVNIVDGNLEECMKLIRAYCARNRKHYNLKDRDLPKGDYSLQTISDGIEDWRRIDIP